MRTSSEREGLLVLWVVVPCYDEQDVLPITAKVLAKKINLLISSGLISPMSRICFVDDGSDDSTWPIIQSLRKDESKSSFFTGIRLAHNEGHQNALYAGLMHALAQKCDCAVSLDADLQDDVNAIDAMLKQYEVGSEIVYGVRSNRDNDTDFKRSTAQAYYSLMNMLGAEVVNDSADFRLMGRKSLLALSHYQEVNLFLRGIVPSLGFTTSKVYYQRGKRAAGKSKYPLKKMILRLGLFALVISIVMLVYAIAEAFIGNVVSGWTSLMVSIWFIGGLVMVSLGIIGGYIGKLYLEVKHRPRYIIEEDLDETDGD